MPAFAEQSRNTSITQYTQKLEIVSFENHHELSTIRYAILSHTWGNDEVSFQDFHEPLFEQKKGFTKIWGCCEQAKKDQIDWVWIDTCCIDKTNSSELSEAINSMYSWYQSSAACYVYLEDVPPREFEFPPEFDVARWFARGWTLQELIAPKQLYFYSRGWTRLGSKWGLGGKISAITGIPPAVLLEGEMKVYSFAERMAWASGRDTSRVEDEAYCLMGIFGVNMPLIYGEGRKAFQRLQHEILRQEEDFSFLLWVDKQHNVEDATVPILAQSPKNFQLQQKTFAPRHAQMEKVINIHGSSFSNVKIDKKTESLWKNRGPIQLTARGLRVRMWAQRETPEFLRLWTEYEYDEYLACISLQQVNDEEREAYDRYAPWEVIWVKKESLADFRLTELYLTTDMARVGTVRRPKLEKLHDRHSDLGISLSWNGTKKVSYVQSYPDLLFKGSGTDDADLTTQPPQDVHHIYCPDVGATNKTFMNSYRRHDPLVLCFQVGESPSAIVAESWFGVRLWLEFSNPRCMVGRWLHTDPHNGRTEFHKAARLSYMRDYKTTSDYSEVELCDGTVMVTVEIKYRRKNPLGDFMVEVVAYEKQHSDS